MDTATKAIVEVLMTKEVLKPYFTTSGLVPNITPEIAKIANDIITDIDASHTHTFQSLLENWNAHNICLQSQESESLCNDHMVYNPQTKKYMDILKPPGGRKKKVEFHPYEFLLEKIESNNVYPLTLRLEMDIEDTLEMLYSENRERREQISDANIRKLAEVLYVLNTDSPYKILDYQSEKYFR